MGVRVAYRDETPFVGRHGELDELDVVLDTVAVDGAGIVVVEGAPGIGKTRLLTEFLEQRRGQLEQVAMTRCVALPHRSYAELSDITEQIVGIADASPHLRELERLGSDLTLDVRELGARLARTFADICDDLLAAIGEERAIIAVDDLHLAEPGVLRFVSFLGHELQRRRRRHRLALVLVTRSLPPGHPLRTMLADLDRAGHVGRLSVGRLDDADASEIARHHVGATTSPSPAYLRLVDRSARGNPLRIRATVAALARRGWSPDEPHAGQAGSVQEAPVLDDPIGAWIEQLPSGLRSSLGAAALFGPEFTPDDAAAAAAISAAAARSHLERAAGLGVLAHDERSYWFAHDHYLEAFAALVPMTDRAGIHARSAHRLERSTTTTPAQELQVARHHLAAGDLVAPDARARALRAGSAAASRLMLWQEAAGLCEAALLIAPDDHELGIELHHRAGRAYYHDHDFEAARAHFRAVADAATDVEEERCADSLLMLIRITTATRAESLSRPTSWAESEAFLAQVSDVRLRSLVLHTMSEAQTTAGRPDVGARLASEAYRLAEESGDPAAMALTSYGEGYAATAAMQVERGVDRTRDALEHARAAGDWYIAAIMLARLPFPLLSAGRLEEADRTAAAAVAEADRCHEFSNQALGNCVRAVAATLRGDLRLAGRFVERARTTTRRSGYVVADSFAGPAELCRELHQGMFDEARRVAEHWPNLAPSQRRVFGQLIALHQHGPAAVDVGQLQLPRTISNLSVGTAAAAIDIAVAVGDANLLDRADGLLEEWSADGLEYPPTCPLSLTRLRADVARARGRTDEALGLYEYAIRTTRANGASLELAQTLHRAAEMLILDSGDHDVEVGVDWAIEAMHLAERIGLRRTRDAAADLAGSYAAVEDVAEHWGVVMITDLVGSSSVSSELGDVAYLQLVLTHHELVRTCIADHHGLEFSEAGDGLLAWFRSADDAKNAALAVQRAAARSAARPRIAVKIGLAGGIPLFYEGRPYGQVLNRAARIVNLADGGQILVDEELAARLGSLTSEHRTVDLRGLGTHEVSSLRQIGVA